MVFLCFSSISFLEHSRPGDLRAPLDLAGDVGPDPTAAQQLAGDVKEAIFLGITGITGSF